MINHVISPWYLYFIGIFRSWIKFSLERFYMPIKLNDIQNTYVRDHIIIIEKFGKVRCLGRIKPHRNAM